MRIEFLEIQNFCQHRRFERGFSNGLIAIIGPNGSGKSNLLGAMRLALTGGNPNVGKKADNISQFAAQGERSYVKMRFSHGSTTATVTRNLYPASPAAILEEAGKTTISGEVSVTNRICEILGTSTEVINDIIIVAQDDIFGFLEKTPTKRAEQFQKLFRTDDAAPVYDLLNKQVNRLSAAAPYTAEQLTAMRAELLQAEADVTKSHEALTALSPIPTCDAAISRWEAVVREAQAATRLRQDYANCQQQLAEAVAHEAAATAHRVIFADTVTSMAAELERSHAAEVVAQATLAAADLYARHAANVVKLQQQQKRADVDLAALSPPVPPAGYPDLDIAERSSQIELAWLGARQQFDALAQSLKAAIARCPSCQSPADPTWRFKESGAVLGARHGGAVAAAIEQVTAMIPAAVADVSALTARRDAAGLELERLTPLLAGIRAQAAVICNYAEDDRRYQQQVKDIVVLQGHIAQQLQQLGDVAPPAGDVDAAKRACSESSRIKTEIATARNNLTQADHALGILSGRISGMKEALAKQQASLATVPAELEAQAATAVTALPAWRQQRAARFTAEQARPLAVLKRDQLQQRLITAEEAMTAAAGDIAWRDYAAAMAALVHCNAAPRFVAQQNLQRLQRVVNDYLEMFQAEFRVVADEGLSFTAHFNDGVRRQPAERLSGGQKVLLALGFRLATNLQLAAGIGGLYLDEPTAYLDKTHIRGFEPALARLRQFCESRGFQCIIVTHETGLAPLFDSIVNLGAA